MYNDTLLQDTMIQFFRPRLNWLVSANNPSRTLRRGFNSNVHLCSSSSSVDQNELSHFNALASEWWDPYGTSRLLHLMNPLRIQFIKRCLTVAPPVHDTVQRNKDPAILTYLDIGCGGGILTESLARLTSTRFAIGLDPSSDCIAVARAHKEQDPFFTFRPEKLRYVNAAIDNFSTEEMLGYQHSFDVVTLMEVIEHVPYPSTFLVQCMKHVKPGGWLILSTIARTWVSWFTTKLVAEDILEIVPRGTHDWRKYVNEEELRAWFGKQGGWGGQLEEKAEGVKGIVTMGCLYVPALGWREVRGGEKVGNYFFAVRRNLE